MRAASWGTNSSTNFIETWWKAGVTDEEESKLRGGLIKAADPGILEHDTLICFLLINCYIFIQVTGGCGWGVEWLSPQPEGRQFDPQSSKSACRSVLGQDAEPELAPIEQKSAANRCTVCVNGWM